MREKDIERNLKKQVEKMGGQLFKWVSPGNDGVPDRIAVLPGGNVWFIELKTSGRSPDPLQVFQLERLSILGCNVSVIRGPEEMADWCVKRKKEVILYDVHSS